MNQTPLELARGIEPELIALRRDFHQHPEVGFEEVRTGGIVADYCTRLGLQVTRAAKTGVIARLNPEKSGPVIALRADMDALPIQEENECVYRSTVPKKGHLCGHDAHTAMLMGAAKLMSGMRDRIPFPVQFIFQPAEETIPSGAGLVLEEGHLKGVNEIYGLHVSPQLPTGQLGSRAGGLMASMAFFDLLIEGTGGHGAKPNVCRDPIVTAAEIIMALQTIVARRVDPIEPAVVSVCMIDAGSVYNVIPPRCKLGGTARSMSNFVQKKLPEWIEEIAAGIAKTHGLSAKLDYRVGTQVLVNHSENVTKAFDAFRHVGGKPVEIPPTMGGEDFAAYLEKLPGAFAFLGAGDGTPRTAQSFHHPRYDIDEKALAWGSAFFVQVILDQAAR